MNLIKRDLLLCLALTALVFVCALAWGNPFLADRSAEAATTHSQQRQSAMFKGTVLNNGDRFLLRDSSGQVLRLDDPAYVRPFEGKAVTITGTLDAGATTIHVERIVAATL